MIASRAEVAVVFASAWVSGVLFGTLPALSTVLTSPEHFDLSPTAYGLLFVPQAIAAIVGAVADGVLTRWIEHRRLLILAMAIGALSLLLLAVAQVLPSDDPMTYATLLLAATALGFAFGLATPLLMTLAGGFFPERRDRAVLFLNGVLAFGPASAPVLVAVAVALDAWVLMPIFMAVVLVVDLLICLRLPLRLPSAAPATPAPGAAPATSAPSASPSTGDRPRSALPRRFWLYITFILLYGMVQTINSNWAALFMTEDVGATAAQGGLALTVFWLMVGVGRLGFGALDHLLPEDVMYRILAFLAAAALVGVSLVPPGDVVMALVAFGIAGVGMSVFLPLTVSFAQREMADRRSFVSGAIFAAFMLGYLITAFGVGPAVEHMGIDPSLLYGTAAIVALVMGGLSFVVVRGLRAVGARQPSGAA